MVRFVFGYKALGFNALSHKSVHTTVGGPLSEVLPGGNFHFQNIGLPYVIVAKIGYKFKFCLGFTNKSLVKFLLEFYRYFCYTPELRRRWNQNLIYTAE